MMRQVVTFWRDSQFCQICYVLYDMLSRILNKNLSSREWSVLVTPKTRGVVASLYKGMPRPFPI
jgi:hypothetical protein